MLKILALLGVLLLTAGALFPGCGGTPGEIIVDNLDSAYVTTSAAGEWDSGDCDDGNGCYGTDFLYRFAHPGETSYVRFSPNIATAGTYTVYIWWSAADNRTTDQPVIVHDGSTDTMYHVNLQQYGHQWHRLGEHTFSAGTAGFIEFSSDTADGYCNADAVRLVFVP